MKVGETVQIICCAVCAWIASHWRLPNACTAWDGDELKDELTVQPLGVHNMKQHPAVFSSRGSIGLQL